MSVSPEIMVSVRQPQKILGYKGERRLQRGSNENTNGLLRQYFPKGMDLSEVHQNRLNAVARRLNERPRETLQFYSPAEKFSECVASTG